jgi:L-ascorbate metabolism protein UlaG (beta-lactamase superfamily)
MAMESPDMKVVYIYNSGFYVELEKTILIFDYASGELPAIPRNKSVYVFISHVHSDHYSPDAMRLGARLEDIHFVLSDDLLAKGSIRFFMNHVIDRRTRAAITWVKPDSTYSIGGIRVKTLTSTDAGVAFLVSVENRNIYHAGDLNMWVWPADDEQMNLKARNAFIKQISKLKDVPIDCAFLTLDPRQENLYAQGFDWFMRHTAVRTAFPMHFGDDRKIVDFLIADPVSEPYRDRIMHTQYYTSDPFGKLSK